MSNSKPEKGAGLACYGGCPGVAECEHELGADVALATAQGPVYCSVQEPTRRNSCPSVLTMGGTGQVGFGWPNGSPSWTEEAARQGFHDKFTEAIGPLTGKHAMLGFSSLSLERLRDPDRLHEPGAVTEDFVKACRAPLDPRGMATGRQQRPPCRPPLVMCFSTGPSNRCPCA